MIEDQLHELALSYIEGKPVVLRVQREGEPIREAIHKLKQAGDKKQAYAMILITLEHNQQSLYGIETIPSSVVVVESLPLRIQQALQKLAEEIPF